MSNVQVLPAGPTSQTANLMVQMATKARTNYKLRELVETVTSKIASRDQLSEVMSWYYYVLRNFWYMNSQFGIELQRDPENMIRQLPNGQFHQGDCNELGPLLAAGYMHMGRAIRFVTGGFGNSTQHTHTWVEVLIGDRWVATDPVAGSRTGAMLRRITTATPFYA